MAKSDDEGIYIFSMGASHLILDGNAWGTPPRIMFATDDIDASHKVCKGLPHETLTDIFRDDYVSVFNINSTMICKTNRDLSLPMPNTNAFLGKMTRIFVHTTNSLQDAIGWYEALLARKAIPDQAFGELPSIRMDKGPHLLFHDNQLSQAPPVFYERLLQELRTNPIAVIESPDMLAALDYVRSKGAVAELGIESRFGIRFFIFHDPDGNGFLVCEA